MSRQHQVLSRPTTILKLAGNQNQHRRIPEDLETGPVKPRPTSCIRPRRACVVHRSCAKACDALNAFNHIESPGNLTAEWRRRLSSVPNHAFDQVAIDRLRLIGTYRPAGVDRVDNVHRPFLFNLVRVPQFNSGCPGDQVRSEGRGMHDLTLFPVHLPQGADSCGRARFYPVADRPRQPAASSQRPVSGTHVPDNSYRGPAQKVLDILLAVRYVCKLRFSP